MKKSIGILLIVLIICTQIFNVANMYIYSLHYLGSNIFLCYVVAAMMLTYIFCLHKDKADTIFNIVVIIVITFAITYSDILEISSRYNGKTGVANDINKFVNVMLDDYAFYRLKSAFVSSFVIYGLLAPINVIYIIYHDVITTKQGMIILRVIFWTIIILAALFCVSEISKVEAIIYGY